MREINLTNQSLQKSNLDLDVAVKLYESLNSIVLTKYEFDNIFDGTKTWYENEIADVHCTT